MSVTWSNSQTWVYNPHSGCILAERFSGKLFDSVFGRNSHPTQKHRLSLILRTNLKQVNKKVNALDANKKNFPIKDWDQNEWYRFTTEFERQSYLWNNRFWLIPPKYFSLLDAKYGNQIVRPNIHCHLITEITNSPGNAHRTIDVVNLDVDGIKKQKGINRPGSGTFRSNQYHLDSLDIKARDTRYTDNQSVEHTIKNHYVIAHELGHAIGLGHIGVLKSTEQCVFAISLRSHGIKNVSSHLKKGADSPVCYGRFESPGLAENVMGIGTKFEEINAQPWIERVAMHTNTLARDWRISLSPMSPKAV